MIFETKHKFTPSGYKSSAGVDIDSCLRCGKSERSHIVQEKKVIEALSRWKSRYQAHCTVCGEGFEAVNPDEALRLVTEHEILKHGK